MNFSKSKYLVMGLVLGSMITMSLGNIYASPHGIIAWINNAFEFQFDGEVKELPEGYNVIVYEGRSYVPARFMAENLGATVIWDEATKTIDIKSKDIPTIEYSQEKEEMDQNNDGRKVEYQKLPVSKAYKGMNITTTVIHKGSTETIVYLTIENKNSAPIQLIQLDTKAVVDNKEYFTKSVPAHKYDFNWYNDIHIDEIQEGFILLPTIPEEAKHMTLYVNILKNDFSQEKEEIILDILLNN